MSDLRDQNEIGTIRGLLTGKHPNEPIFFRFSATFRIHGECVPFDEISQRLGVLPTHFHRKGERRGPHHGGYPRDAWNYEAMQPSTEPFEQHIEGLWSVVQPHIEYLRRLKQNYLVDVCCGYRSNCDCAGFTVSHRALELFTALEVPFAVSVIVT